MSRPPEQREGSPYLQPGAAIASHHRFAAHGRLGSLDLAFQADFTAPWTVLFGPSGCGKSTLLRALCGLTGLRVDLQRQTPAGSQILQDRTRSTPPEARQIAYAPQQAVLFPHLTAQENIAFAETVRPKRNPSQSLVPEAMSLLQLEPLADRLPRQLSGGERQRVSLARALAVPDAQLLLLDEPFAGVDRAQRDQLLPHLQAWLATRNLPALSVTHDIDEPLLLNAEVIRLHNGRNTAQGPARAILADETGRLLRILNSNTTAR